MGANPVGAGPSALRTFSLDFARARKSPRAPAEHQREALAELGRWFDGRKPGVRHGGVLTLPTGGGKTFTAVRFLATKPLSAGCKVLWLAHTHHLLEQVFFALGPATDDPKAAFEVGHVGGTRRTLAARVVSGAPGHHKPRSITRDDDVLIGTLQTIYNAHQRGHKRWREFLAAAKKTGLVLVFDEAHHAPANTYRALVEGVLAEVPNTSVLGLTATPDYGDPRRSGWLRELFPQGIVYQVGVERLIADKVLARPVFESRRTGIVAPIDATEAKALRRRFGDLPEYIIDALANNHERNDQIARRYLAERKRYGQTIIFTDRWFQCEAIRARLEDAGVAVGAVYSYTEPQAAGGKAGAQEKNAATLDRFRRRELEVIVNVRMLTEGTDVPSASTVFLTRQTTSRILLMQMIGRALRGPKFGGTRDAHIVSFVDEWAEAIQWAQWELPVGDTEIVATATTHQQALELVAIDLVQQFVREPGLGPGPELPFLTWLPVGWYEAVYEARVERGEDTADDHEAGPDQDEVVHRLVLVFAGDEPRFRALLATSDAATLKAFRAPDLDLAAAEGRAARLAETHFPDGSSRPGGLPTEDVVHLLRHVAQRGTAPAFHPFSDRDDHDLDAFARHVVAEKLDSEVKNATAQKEYRRSDRFWGALFRDFGCFSRALDVAIFRILNPSAMVTSPVMTSLMAKPGPGDREVPEAVAHQVLARHPACLACGAVKSLQMDHVVPYYNGGPTDLANLQTLCRKCNNRKALHTIDFRAHARPSAKVGPAQPGDAPIRGVADPEAWARHLRREFNFFFRGEAVRAVTVAAGKGFAPEWRIDLHPNVRVHEVEALLRQLLAQTEVLRSLKLAPPARLAATAGKVLVAVTPPVRREPPAPRRGTQKRKKAPTAV